MKDLTFPMINLVVIEPDGGETRENALWFPCGAIMAWGIPSTHGKFFDSPNDYQSPRGKFTGEWGIIGESRGYGSNWRGLGYELDRSLRMFGYVPQSVLNLAKP